MIHHNKTYENVFSTDYKGNRNTVKLSSITIDTMGVEEYIKSFQGFLRNFYDDLFLKCAQLSWLRRKFKYSNRRIAIPAHLSCRSTTGKFIKFLRIYIGHDIHIITKWFFFPKLETYYLDTLIPGFEDGNPFENPEYYKFPFENISLEYLYPVYQLDDKIELLQEADKQKMSFAVFLDYLINHVLCENDRLGYEKYTLYTGGNHTPNIPFFFRDNDKKLKNYKGKKLKI
jgi:hypothetical protein